MNKNVYFLFKTAFVDVKAQPYVNVHLKELLSHILSEHISEQWNCSFACFSFPLIAECVTDLFILLNFFPLDSNSNKFSFQEKINAVPIFVKETLTKGEKKHTPILWEMSSPFDYQQAQQAP